MLTQADIFLNLPTPPGRLAFWAAGPIFIFDSELLMKK